MTDQVAIDPTEVVATVVDEKVIPPTLVPGEEVQMMDREIETILIIEMVLGHLIMIGGAVILAGEMMVHRGKGRG